MAFRIEQYDTKTGTRRSWDLGPCSHSTASERVRKAHAKGFVTHLVRYRISDAGPVPYQSWSVEPSARRSDWKLTRDDLAVTLAKGGK